MPAIKLKPKPIPRRRAKGAIILETLLGMAVAAIAITIAGTAMSQYRSGVRQMLAISNLKAQASAALLSLRAGQAPVVTEGLSLQLQSQEPAPGTPGHTWVQLRASQSGQYATLWGLVPDTSLTHLQPKAP